MLEVCVNGSRRRGEHPALPVTAEDLARDVAAAAAAGVDAVHLHVKDDRGADTLDTAALAAVLTAVHAAVPGLPVGVTTGAWALPDPAARVAAVRSWGDLPRRPDFASVNWHEEGADEVAAALLEVGIGVEAGLWHAAGARAWLTSPHRERCLRVLLELPDGLDAPAVEVETEQLLGLVRAAGGHTPTLLHGEGSSAWPALRLAGRLGLSTRIGLEDVLALPDGSPVPDNAALVRAARDLVIGEHGRTLPGGDGWRRRRVDLVGVDEAVLERLVHAATTDAAADEVTPPLTPGPAWTPARVAWLRSFHRDRRSGVDGPVGEATWAVLADGQLVGSVRLRHTGETGVLETGVWLTRSARGQGVGTAALAALLDRAVELGARQVSAHTTTGNAAALHVLRRLGFDAVPGRDGAAVRALLRLEPAPDASYRQPREQQHPGTPA